MMLQENTTYVLLKDHVKDYSLGIIISIMNIWKVLCE